MCKLLLLDVKKHTAPCDTISNHTVAVKATAWSSHQHRLLTSGGEPADWYIRFWNYLMGHMINCIDMGNQV